MIIFVPWLPWNASAITFWPWIFVHRDLEDLPAARACILTHERVHYESQARWAYWGATPGLSAVFLWHMYWPDVMPVAGWAACFVLSAAAGLLSWHLLYLAALPVGWNPFRWAQESAALKAQNVSDWRIREILRGAPYFLWWMR